MRTDQPVTVLRHDYAAPPYTVASVDLRFELDALRTLVTATLKVCRQPDTAIGTAFELDGEGLELLSLTLDGQTLDPTAWSHTAHGLSILTPPATFELCTVVAIAPQSNTELMGLYLSNGHLVTQCEAQGFRRITYFPDRPDVMARYQVELIADPTRWPVLLSNGNLVDTQRHPDGRQSVRWVDPFPKPCYLFALIAGTLAVHEEHLTTASGRDVLLQVWVEPDQIDRTDYAMQSLIRAIRWDEQRYGLELDLDRFMIVAVADFNMGAMENKGLNIFNTKYVFAHPRIATDTDFAQVESVVAHEYFHNWTGNRVTCRDWFQLTLKEGLTVFRDQEFSADMLAAAAPHAHAAQSARAVARIDDVRVLRGVQFAEDAGPMAHPIRPDRYQAIDNFYTATVYEKGAEVIRMLQTLLGRAGFDRGLALYFSRHDGQAITCEDFLSAMADANGRDLQQFARWYQYAGTPRIHAQGEFDPHQQRYTLTLRQTCPATPGQANKPPLHIPIALGLLGPDGHELLDTVVELTQAQQTFVFEGIAPAVAPAGMPAVLPSLLRHFSAPVVLEQSISDAELAFLLTHDRDAFNRWEAVQQLALRAILSTLAGTPAPLATQNLCAALASVLHRPELETAFRAQLLLLPSEGLVAEHCPVLDPQALRAARQAVRHTLARALAHGLQTLVETLPPQQPYRPDPPQAGARALRNAALALLVEAGVAHADDQALTQLRQTDNMTDRMGALAALTQSASRHRETALADFAHTLHDEPLAMDKWLMLQATMHRQAADPPVLERVRTLTQHPSFTHRNPNKVRALISAFCGGNLAEFHTSDGAGYAFWVDHVLILDQMNPQIAARLARALDRWRQFTPALQTAMQSALHDVAQRAQSPDVREIVQQALG